MYTIEKIITDFELGYNIDWKEGTFHKTLTFPHQKTPCETYIFAQSKTVSQLQVDTLNQFLSDYRQHVEDINNYFLDNLDSDEFDQFSRIKKAALEFFVIHVPLEKHYDFVLVCSKQYRIFFQKQLATVRVEFKSGKIQSMNRTLYGFEENE